LLRKAFTASNLMKTGNYPVFFVFGKDGRCQQEHNMAFDEGLAHRVREQFADQPTVVEKKMFGGLAFMIQGNMSVGILGDTLMVRVGPDDYEAALAQPHAAAEAGNMRPMKGFVYVPATGIEEDEALTVWVERGKAYALSLPAK
jgi:TfoX/Sxy family transcriptional regulator of competence genes